LIGWEYADMNDSEPDLVYRIDRNDLLVGFNRQWNIFARDNGALDLLREKSFKKPLWSFIHDVETRHVHQTLLNKVRAGKTITGLPFRCDSPLLRRFMEMDILPLGDGKVEYRCRTVKTEPRKMVPLHYAKSDNGEPLLRMCSWCKKVDTGNGNWDEIENAISLLGIFSQEKVPTITHTICDACASKLDYAN
jgi:hypothetical protein